MMCLAVKCNLHHLSSTPPPHPTPPPPHPTPPKLKVQQEPCSATSIILAQPPPPHPTPHTPPEAKSATRALLSNLYHLSSTPPHPPHPTPHPTPHTPPEAKSATRALLSNLYHLNSTPPPRSSEAKRLSPSPTSSHHCLVRDFKDHVVPVGMFMLIVPVTFLPSVDSNTSYDSSVHFRGNWIPWAPKI